MRVRRLKKAASWGQARRSVSKQVSALGPLSSSRSALALSLGTRLKDSSISVFKEIHGDLLLGFIAIMSVSAISPRNKVQHSPFCFCRGIFGYKLFLKGYFLCLNHNLPSIFLAFGILSFNFSFGGFSLGALLSAELSLLDSVHSPMFGRKRSWHSLERFRIFAKSEGEINSAPRFAITHFTSRAATLE